MSVTATLLTTGEIAKRLNQPLHRILRVIDTRGITPSGRAGVMRVFRESDVTYIESEIKRIDFERGEL
jgi:hypothetical protein